MLTRQEKEGLVIDLYNQGKTIRDIAKEVRMSFRDIGSILKRVEKEENRTSKNYYFHPLKLTAFFRKVSQL